MTSIKPLHLVSFFFSFLLYFLVNEVIAHAALIVSKGRLVGYPVWIARFCKIGIGYSYEYTSQYVLWFVFKLIFVLGVSYVFLKRGYFIWLRFVVGVYLVTGILHVILSVLFSFVEWDSYFFSSFPVFLLREMTGYPGWWFMLAETLFFLGLFSVLNKVKLKEHLFHFGFVPFSFLLYFLGCYLYLGYVVCY
ncbi:MAG: hypothetical protein ACK4LB_15055 [Spirosomataceae bacterium]